MTLGVPLAVRIKTTRSDRHVTRDLRDLTFTELATGGYSSARFSFDRPLMWQPDEVAYYAPCYIYDTRSGELLWAGRLEDPGAGADGSGSVWDLTAMGPSAHTRDKSVPLYYVDSRSEKWIIGGAGGHSRHVDVTTSGEETPTITMKLPNGSTFSNGDAGLVVHIGAYETGQTLSRIQFDWDGGAASSNFKVRLSTAALPAASAERVAVDLNTTGGTITSVLGGTLPTGEDAAFLRFARITSNFAVTDEAIWAEFSNFVLRTRLLDKDGTNHSGYSSNTVLASEIVADVLGRLLPMFNGTNATVSTTTHGIDQLIYPDAVNAAKILEDLMGFEPAYRWGAYEPNSAGLYRFEWVAWPTQVRYECDILDGLDLPGSGEGLYNAVRIRFVGPNGQRKTVKRTASVPELDDAGLERVADLDLGDEVGSTANANRAGDEFLAEHATPPAGGRLVIARPILDLISGRMVDPSAIRAGQLIRLRGLTSRTAALTATGRDGVSVFKIASKEYRAADGAATLELDQYSLSTSRALAELSAATPKRRRRR